ncbi:MAG: HEAT repeat domain-containing protein [Cyanobacteria bacterium P01_E01_bin.6]
MVIPTLVLETLAGWGISKAADTLFDQSDHKLQRVLNKSDLEAAISAGVKAAEKWDSQQPHDQHLFYRCEKRNQERFKEQVFQDSGVLQELGKALKDQGKPREEFLVERCRSIASAVNAQLVDSTIESWVRHFADAYFESTNNYTHYQLDKQRYFTQLQTLCDDVQLLGVAVEGREDEKRKKLLQIFVMPDVKEKQTQSVKPPRAYDGYPYQISTDEDRLTVQLLQEPSDDQGRTFLAHQLLEQPQKRSVLLGNPGSGKTTFMNYLAFKVARGEVEDLGLDPNIDWIPLLIRIREWEKGSQSTVLEYATQFCKRYSVDDLHSGFFEYWLDRGQVIILLDGLDEVADEAKRQDIAQRIESFLERYQSNPAVITSRPSGYQWHFRTDVFPHYELQPFDDQKITSFITKWYDSRAHDSVDANEGKQSLQKAIDETDRIKQLARNPLLLTIVALIHRYEAYLPKQRHELYERAVKTLLVNWDKGKGLTGEQTSWNLQYLKQDDLLPLMRQLAYWVHRQGDENTQTTGTDGGTLIEGDELKRQISRMMQLRKKDLDLAYAQEDAERLIKFIRGRTGLLNEQGRNLYAFVHKTFQEYLAAEEIYFQHELEDDVTIILNHITEHLHDPHWREVILLLVARQVGKRAERAIRAVLGRNSPYEQWLHRDLLFAGECLAENPQNLNTSAPDLHQEVLTRLVNLEVSPDKKVGREIRKQSFRILCNLHETEFEAQTLELLKQHDKTINQWRLFEFRFALGEQKATCNELLALLSDPDADTRANAAYALVSLGNRSEAVVSGLLALLSDPDADTRARAAYALGNLGNSSEAVVSGLLALLSEPHLFTRASAAEALVTLGNRSEAVVSGLLALLNDPHLFTRESAAAAGTLGNHSEAVSALQSWLKEHQPLEDAGDGIDVLYQIVVGSK